MGNLTLFVSLTGTFLLLIRDGYKRRELSPAVWVPTAWFLLECIKPISVWLRPSTAAINLDYGAGSPIDRTILMLLMLLALLVLFSRRADWGGVVRTNHGVLVMLCLMAVSIIWSDYPGVSLRRYYRTLGDVLMALVLLTEYSPLDAIRAVMRRTAFLVLPLSIVLIKYFRYLGVEYSRWEGREMWIGVTQQKNSLGILCGIIALSILTEIIDGRRQKNRKLDIWIRIGLLGMSTYLLVGSHSATALGVCLGGALLLLWSARWKGKPRHAGVPVFLLLVIVAGSLLSQEILGSVASIVGRDTTLTGRTEIWAEVIKTANQRPILGVGYGALWVDAGGGSLMQNVGVNSAHSGYIETYAQLGIVGICVLGFMLATSYLMVAKSMEKNVRYGVYRFVFLLIVIVHNITESTLLTSTTLWFIYLCVALDPIACMKSIRQASPHATQPLTEQMHKLPDTAE